MNCNKAQEWISLQMDGQLPAQHVPLLQEHLTGCAVCRLYCDEFLLGRRLLAAIDPVPPDNFDWKLQLRLNHAMREAAREIQFPWSRPPGRWRFWLSRAGLAAPLGLAAVMVLSLVLPTRTLFVPADKPGQVAETERPLRLPYKETAQRLTLFDSSRRPLDSPFQTTSRQQGLSGVQRQVGAGSVLGQRTWSTGGSDLDLARVRQLEQNVEALRRVLNVRDRQIQLLEAKLDSLARLNVDTAKED